MRILHITDFHIDNPDSENENLRHGYYEEFIDGLFAIIDESGLGQIDLVVNTGDFVNIGKTENFPHARKVLNYILKKAGLDNKDIAVCIGNHDFKMKEAGTWIEKKLPFDNFSSDLVPGELVDEVDRAKLYFNSKNIQILILDNASREDNTNEPVPLSVAEQDNIVRLVRNNLTAKDLIVISHYPMLVFPFSKYAAEDQDWVKSHVWSVGHNIQHRISQVRQQGETIFLCGDGHIPDAFQSGNRKFVMTGLFGGNYTKRTYEGKPVFMQTQARVLEFGHHSILYTFNYKPEGFQYDLSHGSWLKESAPLRQVIDKPKTIAVKSSSKTQVLSEPLEIEIMNRVKKEKLYKLGRFVTSAEFNSLSWISINRLFEEQQIFVSLVDKALEWLTQIIKDPAKAIIIGVDFYGAMIGTHLAVRANIYNECLTSKFLNNGDYDEINKVVMAIKNTGNIRDLVIVTDVVSSGSSLIGILSEIENTYKNVSGSRLEVKYHSISVIADNNIVRDEFDNKLTTIKTACGSLRMPIVRSSELPDLEILSGRLDFTN